MSKNKINILALTGGGVKGIMSARILQEIETRTGKAIYQLFDAIAGTSTGGIIAALCTIPDSSGRNKFTAKDAVDFYFNKIPKVFAPETIIEKLADGFGLWGAKYERKNFDQIAQQTCGKLKISDTLIPIMLNTLIMETCTPFTSCTIDAKQSPEKDFYLSDVVGATSAAPTYFAPKVVTSITNKTKFHGTDGGLFANNPSLSVVPYLKTLSNIHNCKYYNLLSLDIDRLESLENINHSNNGIGGWLLHKNIINTMFDARQAFSDLVSQNIVDEWHQIKMIPQTDEQLEVDNISLDNLKSLVAIAEDYISKNSEQIDKICQSIIR